MSFGAPLVLAALVLVPVAIVLYVRQQRHRRRGRGRVRVARAARRRSRRAAPAGAATRRCSRSCSRSIVLVVAAAKPQQTVAVPVERAAIMLATDVSGSMEATDVKPSRLVAARRAAQNFVNGVPRGVNIGDHGLQRPAARAAEPDARARRTSRPRSTA